MSNICNRIAVVCPDFFGYPIQIRDSLARMGFEVNLFDERASNKVLDKILLRLSGPLFLRKSIARHYEDIIRELEANPVDILFLIDPEAITREIVLKIKSKIGCRVFLYMWDSAKNKGGFLNYLDVCDKAFTFDPKDSNQYSNLEFLPLFYADQYSKVKESSIRDIDVCFVGTLHSDRYKVLKQIEVLIEKHGLKVEKHIYIQSKFLYFLRKLLNISLWASDFNEFTTRKLSTNEVADLFSRSKIVIDINHPGQIGLTSRTFESLKSGAKLITTNAAVSDYSFYNPSMISIIDRNNVSLDSSFLHSDTSYVDMSKYSLESWLKYIFDLK